jgi:hypothetical protein
MASKAIVPSRTCGFESHPGYFGPAMEGHCERAFDRAGSPRRSPGRRRLERLCDCPRIRHPAGNRQGLATRAALGTVAVQRPCRVVCVLRYNGARLRGASGRVRLPAWDVSRGWPHRGVSKGRVSPDRRHGCRISRNHSRVLCGHRITRPRSTSSAASGEGQPLYPDRQALEELAMSLSAARSRAEARPPDRPRAVAEHSRPSPPREPSARTSAFRWVPVHQPGASWPEALHVSPVQLLERVGRHPETVLRRLRPARHRVARHERSEHLGRQAGVRRAPR